MCGWCAGRFRRIAIQVGVSCWPGMVKSLLMASPPKPPWQITARDPAELFSQFGLLGIRTPGRTGPKDQFAEEIYCLRPYLFPLADSGFLQVPPTPPKCENPPFNM